MTEPVTLSEAKLAARIDADDTALDALLSGLITAAREQAEQITGRYYVGTTVRRDLTDWPAADDVLPVYAARAVAINYWSGGVWVDLSGAGFVYAASGPGTVLAPALGAAWPALGEVAIGPRVRVDITAGLVDPTTAPEQVKLYIKALVSFWVDNPAAAAGRGDPGDQLHRLLDRERIWS